MAARFLVCVALIGAVLLPAQSSRSEVIHGFQVLRPIYVVGFPDPQPWDDAFDFLTQTVIPFGSDAADLCYQENVRGDDWHFWARSGDGFVIVNAPLEEVQVAPAITGNDFTAYVVRDRTYVTKTGDGLYAKFAVREGGACCSLLMEYYVQMDGSPGFGPALPVRQSTWGRVKALYR